MTDQPRRDLSGIIHAVIGGACGISAGISITHGNWQLLIWQLISLALVTWWLWTAKRLTQHDRALRRRLSDEIWDAAAARGNKITNEANVAYLACYRIVRGDGWSERPVCDATGTGLSINGEAPPNLACNRAHGHRGMHHDPTGTNWEARDQDGEGQQ